LHRPAPSKVFGADRNSPAECQANYQSKKEPQSTQRGQRERDERVCVVAFSRRIDVVHPTFPQSMLAVGRDWRNAVRGTSVDNKPGKRAPAPALGDQYTCQNVQMMLQRICRRDSLRNHSAVLRRTRSLPGRWPVIKMKWPALKKVRLVLGSFYEMDDRVCRFCSRNVF
jgi:hypothetical protein